MKIGKISGIEIALDWSWFPIFGLLWWSTANGYMATLPDLPAFLYWVMGFGTALGLFGSVLFHELCHSFVAKAFKIPVRRIVLFILGGYAEIQEDPSSPRAEFLMSAAGPLSSFALFCLLMQLANLGQILSFPIVSGVALSLAQINLMLAVFNLLPGFPLDGGRMLKAGIWKLTRNVILATKIACRVGKFFAILFIIVGIFFFLMGVPSGFMLFFIGLFLKNAADATWKHSQIQAALKTITAENLAEDLSEVDLKDVPNYLQRGWVCYADEEVAAVWQRMRVQGRAKLLIVTRAQDAIGKITSKGIRDYAATQGLNV